MKTAVRLTVNGGRTGATASVAALVNVASFPASSVTVTFTLMVLPCSLTVRV